MYMFVCDVCVYFYCVFVCMYISCTYMYMIMFLLLYFQCLSASLSVCLSVYINRIKEFNYARDTSAS